MRKEYELQKRKTGKFKLKMTFAILVLAALSIVEVYLMMNYQMEYLYLGAMGLLILCFVYWIVDISFRMQAEDDTAHEKEYENLYKAEKVSYISMKQGLLDIENILKGMEDLPVDDVIQSQKAIGKVTIQRNKESMQSVIDAQKELKERINAMEEKLNEFQVISERQQEILNAIQNLEVSVKEGLSGAAAFVPAMQDNHQIQEPNFAEEAERLSSEEPSTEDESPLQEQAAEEEAAPGAMMTEEQIAELLSSQEQAEEEAAEEPQNEEPEPGAMMTEEQIAELLSSQEQAEETSEETSEESSEEKPAMPDLSDPGHVMTPEEIAALLANM
ncbi:MAG: hypothetical protein HFJ04_04525 [Lachnospiraceae bacterium]|nr:hypothetical protein [Lachnospiraceae bacterium]